MKKDIQPNYGKCEIKCVCGNVIETGSVKSEIRVDTCSKCHTFFTGKSASYSEQGRAAKFTEKFLKNK